MTLQSAKLGLCFGMMLPAEGVGAREPVAYLYNGVRLPKLPEHRDCDFLDAPLKYAVIRNENGEYVAYFMPAKLVRMSESTEYAQMFRLDDSEVSSCCWVEYRMNSNGQWEKFLDTHETGPSHTETGVGIFWVDTTSSFTMWANYNIFNEDGTVYLAKSDPIPVYE